MARPGKQTEDDIYCACLSKALCHISTPVTVGFYAPFGSRVYMLLDKITKCMREEASRIEEKEWTKYQEKPRKPEGLGFLRLLWHLMFYKPLITDRNTERKNIQFVFVPFSAWQYSGSDRLWAGLVTTLCDRVRSHFGAFPIGLYNALGNAPKRAPGDQNKEWAWKKAFCFKLALVISVFVVGIVLPFVPTWSSEHEVEEESSSFTVIGSLAAIVSGSSIIMTIYKVGKNVVISQKKKIENMINSQKFSTQMGFMSEVKKEIEVITQLVKCMEIFQKQKIRIVLQITSLELCAPDKVIGVLDAMNTLLSDRSAPFISILVVDPSIIVSCLESAGSMKGMADNGYMYLSRTVTLPFSVPPLGTKNKLLLLRKAVQGTEDLIDWPCRNDVNRGTTTGIAESARLLRDELAEDGGDREEESFPHPRPGRYIQEAFYALHNEQGHLHEYIPDSIAQMKRIVNTIPVTIHLMILNDVESESVCGKSVAAWVVLCNQWPCRLSWILQCLEDEQQVKTKEDFDSRLLWDIFMESSKELHSMKANLKNILDLDADPEVFQRFLSKDFQFTVRDAVGFLNCTVNLDTSIKSKMGLIRGVNRLENNSA